MTSEQDISKIRELMEFLVRDKVAQKLKELNETERKIYDLTGEKGQTEIVKFLNVAPNTVSNTWRKLESEGLLVREGNKYKKVV